MLIGVILAGGQSRRMGVDKATLRLGDQTLLQHAHNMLVETGCTQICMSGSARPDWLGDYVTDLWPQSGPVGGILSTIAFLQTMHAVTTLSPPHILFVPVDTPLLQATALKQLCDHTAEATIFEGSPLPLRLQMTPHVLHTCQLMRGLLQKGCSVKQFLGLLIVKRVPCGMTERDQLRNANTPNDWRQICDECTT